MMQRERSVVVIGGGYAGVLAAMRAARALGDEGEVVLVSERDALIERIRLHESAARGRDPRQPLEALLRGTGVRLVCARATDVDRDARTVRAGDHTLRFDRLIVAIGTRSGAPELPGAAEHAHLLEPERIAELASTLREVAARGGRVVIVGGGLSGLETATELAEEHRGLRVVLATAGEVGERLGPAARAHVRRVCARLGVDLREHVRVERIEERAVVIDGAHVEHDVCVVAAGFVVPQELARWGFPTDARGRARVDDRLRLEGAPHVYVAGDCAVARGVRGSPATMGCKSAMPMGAQAGDNAAASLLGRRESPHAWVDAAWCTSLGRRDAILQPMRPDGTPTRAFVAGWLAARIKEIICRHTVRSLELERSRVLRYRWPRGWISALPGRVLRALPAEGAGR